MCSPGANQYVVPGLPKFTRESSPAGTVTAPAGGAAGPLSSCSAPHTAFGGAGVWKEGSTTACAGRPLCTRPDANWLMEFDAISAAATQIMTAQAIGHGRSQRAAYRLSENCIGSTVYWGEA